MPIMVFFSIDLCLPLHFVSKGAETFLIIYLFTIFVLTQKRIQKKTVNKSTLHKLFTSLTNRYPNRIVPEIISLYLATLTVLLRTFPQEESKNSLLSGSGDDPFVFNIPHALTVVEDRGQVCTADRERGRVACFRADNGTYVAGYSSWLMGTRIYSVAYSPVHGSSLFTTNELLEDY